MSGLFKESDLRETTISSELVYEGDFLKLYKDSVQLSDGTLSTREYLTHPGAVAIVALNENNALAMERQFRHPFNRVTLEIPAGKLDKGEQPLEGAKRELEEETGIVADEYRYLGPIIPNYANSTEVIHLYLATSLHYGQRHLDTDELLNVEMMNFDEVYEMVMNGQIADGKSIAAILKAHNILKRNG